VLAVVAAFFGGLALGGLALGARIEPARGRCTGTPAASWSSRCWSLVLLFVAPPFSSWVLRAIGVEPSAGWQ